MGRFRKDPGDGRTGAAEGDLPPNPAALMREAPARGSAFATRDAAPGGRAARLNSAEPPAGSEVALSLPFAFLRLGDTRRAEAELGGRLDGLDARVFDFTAADHVGSGGGEGTSGFTAYPYHVAAVELGFRLPWLAVCVRRVPQPSHRLYPGRRSLDLVTSDRRISRDYRLYADDFRQAGSVLDGPVRAWLPGALSRRFGHRSITVLEVAGGWAMAAVQADRQARLGQPEPWPDALLDVLRQFRDTVPDGWRHRAR